MDVNARDEHLHYKDKSDVDEKGDAHEDEEYSCRVSEYGQNYSRQRHGLWRESEMETFSRKRERRVKLTTAHILRIPSVLRG